MDNLDYQLIEAMVQCFGRAFHYKDNVELFLISCGVDKPLAKRYRDEHKFVWAKSLLTDLSQTDSGRILQRRILTNLCRLRKLPDNEVKDKQAGLDALRRLKELAVQYQLYAEEAKRDLSDRRRASDERQAIILERKKKLETIHRTWNSAVIAANRQAAGYSLEDILAELFSLYEIEYRKSIRTETEQIDGHFQLDGFGYLVEAKWRNDRPTEGEIGSFERKVTTKLESTRGLFISVIGYRNEVIDRFSSGGSLILIDGSHITAILEGQWDLKDLLRAVIKNAEQYGRAYSPISAL